MLQPLLGLSGFSMIVSMALSNTRRAFTGEHNLLWVHGFLINVISPASGH